MAHRGSAAIISSTECCLTNTVDTQISAAVRVKARFQPLLRKAGVFQAANITAREPIT